MNHKYYLNFTLIDRMEAFLTRQAHAAQAGTPALLECDQPGSAFVADLARNAADSPVLFRWVRQIHC